MDNTDTSSTEWTPPTEEQMEHTIILTWSGPCICMKCGKDVSSKDKVCSAECGTTFLYAAASYSGNQERERAEYLKLPFLGYVHEYGYALGLNLKKIFERL